MSELYLELAGQKKMPVIQATWSIKEDYTMVVGVFYSPELLDAKFYHQDKGLIINGVRHVVRIKLCEEDKDKQGRVKYKYHVEKRVDKRLLELSSKIANTEQQRESLLQLIMLLSESVADRKVNDLVSSRRGK